MTQLSLTHVPPPQASSNAVAISRIAAMLELDRNTPGPTEIKLRLKSLPMELEFPNGSRYEYSIG